MFDFRIIDTPDGNQVIDRNLKTPCSALTPLQYMEYTNIEVQLYIADRQKKKFQEKVNRRRKLARNPFVRFACFCGLVQVWKMSRIYKAEYEDENMELFFIATMMKRQWKKRKDTKRNMVYFSTFLNAMKIMRK